MLNHNSFKLGALIIFSSSLSFLNLLTVVNAYTLLGQTTSSLLAERQLRTHSRPSTAKLTAAASSLALPAAVQPSTESLHSVLQWLSAFYENNPEPIQSTSSTSSSQNSINEEEFPTSKQPTQSGVVSTSNTTTFNFDENPFRALFPSSQGLPFGSSHSSSATQRDYDFSRFLNFDDLSQWYTTRMNDNNADSTAGVFVERQQLATTAEGRPVTVYKITSAINGRRRDRLAQPVLWMDCLIHAREWIAGSTCSYMFDKLLKDSRTDSQLRTWLQKADVWMVPVMNPDGYQYTFTKNRFWRKNRQPNPSRPQCPGIDLNRNWPAFYAESNLVGPLSSSNSCDDLYAGTTYLTTPEAKGVFDFLTNNRNLIKIGLTFHSFGQLWLIPYGYSDTPGRFGPKFPRYDSTYALFKPAVDALQQTRRSHASCSTGGGRNTCEYELGNTVDVIGYAGGGGSDDSMAAMGICHVATVELSPTGTESVGRNSFDISATEIPKVGEEVWQATRVLLQSMANTMTTSYCLSAFTPLPPRQQFNHNQQQHDFKSQQTLDLFNNNGENGLLAELDTEPRASIVRNSGGGLSQFAEPAVHHHH